MALSGYSTKDVSNFNNLRLEWEVVSQSTANNTSDVRWVLYLETNSLGEIQSTAGKKVSVTVNGKVWGGTNSVGAGNNAKEELWSGRATFEHTVNGSLTLNFSISQEFNILWDRGVINTISWSFSAVVDRIPRASQPSLVTWPETTNDVGDFGETFSIHMNRVASVFTHTVRYEYGNRSGVIATGVATGTTWAVPMEFIADIPNATSASGRIYVDTYEGNTLIGTKYTGFTVEVPASVKPSCGLTLEDVTDTDGLYGSPVKSLSRIKATVKATTAYGSPIKSYTISIDGASYSRAEVTTDFLRNAGTSRVTATVKDSRGRVGTTYYDMNVQDYTAPVIPELIVRRCNADGTENDQGEHSQTIFSAALTSLNSKNTAAYTLRYKKTGASAWTEIALTALNNKYTVTDHVVVFPADGNSSYDVEIVAHDSHSTTTRVTSLSTAFTLMNWGANGTSMGIGKVAEAANTLEVGLNSHFYGSMQQEGNRYAFSSPGVAGTGGFVLMAQIQVTAANADTPITFVFTRRQAVAPMTVHLRLNNPTATTSSLASIRYEGENYGAFAYAEDDLLWNLYVLKGSNYDTITLQDWHTSKTMDSRVKVTFPGELVDEVPLPYYRATPAPIESLLDYVYPVGSIYLSYSHVSPAELFGGTWARIENAFLWAVDPNGAIGQTGGSETHTLTVDELPAHSHGSVYSQHATGTKDKAWYTTSGSSVAYGAVSTGGGAAHNNMPPYIQVSVWRRTA